MQPVAVCLKWTTPFDVEPGDERFAGISESDQAALELGLRFAEQLGTHVTVVTVGPPGSEHALRDALACGAARAVRVDTGDLPSADVARHLARQVDGSGLVVCGDLSADRGTGSVPAFVAHHLARAQALGLIAAELGGFDGSAHVEAVRRLDGGRRERLRVALPCVLSVEGSVASLRRASLRAALAARTAPVTVVAPGGPVAAHDTAVIVAPFRPRARVLPPPTGEDVLDRLRALTDAGADGAHGEIVTLDPPAAAARIVSALREWGYLLP